MKRLFLLATIFLCSCGGGGGGGSNNNGPAYELKHTALTVSGTIPTADIGNARVRVNGNEATVEGQAWVITINGSNPDGILVVEYLVNDILVDTYEVDVSHSRSNTTL